jgi:acylphosphatase
VGFRYTTCRVARRYAVSGFVQNLADGRVVVVAEGTASELDRFLADVREVMAEYIRGAETVTAPGTGEFQGFGIRY